MAVVDSGVGGLPFPPFNIDSPLQGSVALTVAAAAVQPGRAFRINCTVAGNVVVTMADGSSETIAAAVGYTILPFAVTVVASATATATYANLK
jgi:hypothetical protein